ncbi:MAG: S8/S53 family peptidase [Actinobacteria bacterium]|jgi:hypothetical protein|nr:S8/S53 family peptidase [Actinomycetota bacterium]
MTDFWRSERLTRITDPASTSPVVVEDGAGGGFAYHPTRFLISNLALQRIGALLVAPDFRNLGHEFGWLPELGLHAFELLTGEALLDKLPVLEAEISGTLQPGDDPAEAFVSVDHALFGAPKYHGDPASAPMPAAPWAVMPPITGAGAATAALLDTGVDLSAEFLLAGAVRDADDVDQLRPVGAANQSLGSQAGHGTFILGLLQRMSGGDLRVDVGRVLSPDGVGYDSLVSKEIKELAAAAVPVGVVNMSIGGYTDNDRMPAALSAALGRLPATTVVVAAAGNGDDTCPASDRPIWPGAGDGVVAVGSVVDVPGGLRRSVFSNFGPWVDVWTLGEDLLSTYATGDFVVDPNDVRTFDGWATWSGTSFAAGLVSAEIARRMKQGLTGADAWATMKAGLPSAGDALVEADTGVTGLLFDPVSAGVGLDPRLR